MWVAVLTASAGVPDTDVAAVRDALSGGVAERRGDRWVEIPLSGPPKASLPPLSTDVTCLPAVNRAKKLLIADMDSTMIAVECIDELADYAGVKSEVAAITERAMAGALDFEAALLARVALLEGLPVETLEACVQDRVRANPGAKTLVQGMLAAGAATALVSGGFTFFTERVARDLGFQTHSANVLEIAGGRLTGRVVGAVLGPRAKRARMDALMAAHGIAAADVLAVGDGANDIDMVEAAGLGVGYRPKPALAAVADTVLWHSDLGAILAIQSLLEGTRSG